MDTPPLEKGAFLNEVERAAGLKALGSSATEYNFGLDGHPPDPAILEKFESPAYKRLGHAPGGLTVDIEAPEFSCLCPKTRQPDWATIVVKYIPGEWCVESKSFKLYLGQFRMFGSFHEAVVDRIGMDLIALLDPIALRLQGQFTARGGIRFWPTLEYKKPQAVVGIVGV